MIKMINFVYISFRGCDILFFKEDDRHEAKPNQLW